MTSNEFDPNLILSIVSSISFNVQALVGAFIIWVFSWLWHDFIVVKPWFRWTKMTPAEANALHEGKLNQNLGLYLISKIVLSYIVLLLAAIIQTNSFFSAVMLACAISFGIVFSCGVGPVIFENRHPGLWFLSSALTTLSVLALLLLRLVWLNF